MTKKGQISSSYDTLGLILNAQGNYAAALQFHQKALDIELTSGKKQPDPGILGNIGNVYENLGNYELAIDYFQKAENAFESTRGQEAATYAAYSVDNIGTAAMDSGQYDKALEYFLRGQKLKAALLSDDPTTYYNLAAVYQKMGRVANALDAAQKAVDVTKKVGDNDGLAYALVLSSELYNAQKEFTKSLDLANEALSVATRYKNPTRLWRAYLAAANAQIGLGKQDEAKALLERSIETTELLRKQLVAADEKQPGTVFRKGRSIFCRCYA